MSTLTAVKPQNKPYTGYGAARTLWSCRDPEILMDGPAGTGKSRAILEKINFCAMKYPGMRALIARKTRESMTESVLVTLEDKVLPAASEVLDGPQRRLRQSYNYENGSRIVVGGMDNSAKIMSTEYDIIGLFETTEFSEDDLESLTTRLRNGVMPYQQLICDCNPSHPNHWLNRRAEKRMTRLLSRHQDNPVYYDMQKKQWTAVGKVYIGRLGNLTGARKERLLHGRWAAAEGMVYELFDPATHVIDRFPIPKAWRRIRTIDFGYNNPFTCQWWAVSPDGDLHLYREIYHTKRTVRVHSQKINELSKGERYEATIADHDAEDRATLEECGIHTLPAWKAITPGIEAVVERLKVRENKRPRIYFHRNSLAEEDLALAEANLPKHTVEEFDGYLYPKTVDGKPIKEEPVDKDNHGMDAMRYAVAYVDDVQAMTLQVTAESAQAVYT